MEHVPSPPRVPDRAWLAFLAVGLVAVGGYALLPADGTAAASVYTVVNGAAVVALVVGIRQRPFAPLAWRLVLTALVVQFVLNGLNLVRTFDPGLALPEEAISAGFLVPYAVLAAAFVTYAVACGSTADRTALLDAAIIVVGIAVGLFLLMTQSIAPLDESAIAVPGDAVTSFFIGVPPLVLGIWLLLTPGASTPAVGLLTLGVAVQSFGDAILGLGPYLSTRPQPESVWLASIVVLGAAGLHPSVAARAGAGAPALLRGTVRFTLLSAAILVPALGDAPHHLLSDESRPIAFAIVSAVVLVLAVVRLRGLVREVDERRAEEAASRAFAEELVATSPGIVVRGRVSGAVLTYASPALVKVLGYRPEDIVNVPGWWPGVVHPDDLGAFPSILGDEGATAGTVVREARLRHADGTYRNLFFQSERTPSPDGEPDMFVGTILDVTDWRAAQSELAAAKGYLDDVIGSTSVVFLRGHGPELILDYASPNVETVLGYRAGELIGRPGWLVAIVHPDELETTDAAIAASAERHEERYATDLRFIAADGQTRAMYAIIRRAFAEDGTWTFTGTLLDITERKATEEALRLAKDEAERANQARSEFLSGVSHELRTPLNAVLGFGQLLEQSALAPKDRDSVEQILKGGRRLLRMLDGVLDLTRVDAGRLTLSIEPVDVDEVVHDAADLVRPSAFEHGVTIALPPRSRPAAFVSADRQRLKQVLHNLLSNAAKYSPDGALVEVAVAAGSTAGRWRISVRDTGPGVPVALQSRLFQPFERSWADVRAGGGLGVGLALSAKLVRLMAGTIGVDSVPGTGSTFWVELPAADEPRELAVDAADPAQTGAPGPPGGRTVVYIEDNLANLGLVERLLAGRPGTRLLAAMQGRLGLELVRRQAVDLVLLDLQLPDLPGEEVLNQLRGDERTRVIPVLILSANDDPRARARLRGLGADGYLDKPLDVADFLRQVDRLLEAGRANA